MRIGLALLAAVVLCGGCGGGSGGGSGDPDDAPVTLPKRVAPSIAFPIASAFSVAYPGVEFDLPLVVTAAPGDTQHLYVATQGGTIWVFDRSEDVTTKRVFLDLTDRTRANGEQGLLGMAFDPQYPSNGRVYVYYSANANPSSETGDNVVARYTADVAAATADRTTETKLLQIPHPQFNNHNGGMLAVGPDGMLYLGVGDGGSGGDPNNHAQDLGSLLGKILRIAPDGTIPSDNPFAGTAGARGEIWAYGLRNPFRFSFDNDGRLWAGDVGQNLFEEVDLITRGGNYGWRKFEGNHVFDADDPTPAGAIAPLTEYGRDLGSTVIGGLVYRGTRFPGLVGRYLYGDFGSGRIWALAASGNTVASNVELGSVPTPSSFGRDTDGEPLITSYNGKLYRLSNDVPVEADLPKKLSQTGIFTDPVSLTPSAGVLEYTVNAPFWSDGAKKRRWIAVPGNGDAASQRIDFSATGSWTFPRGTILVKEFEIDLADGSHKRLELRVLVNRTGGWTGYTYRWNDDGTDADLLVDGATVTLNVLDPSSPTGSRTQTYEFPTRAMCGRCHNGVAGGALGVRTKQLNGDFHYPNLGTGNQLLALESAGYFNGAVGDVSTLPALVDPYGNAGVPLRARAWLDANCSQCHRPNGPTPAQMDLRWETATAAIHAQDVAPVGDSFGIENAKLIAPGDHARSLVWVRMSAADSPKRMPPVATHVVDAEAAALLQEWIDEGVK